jgi:hypothetical protein
MFDNVNSRSVLVVVMFIGNLALNSQLPAVAEPVSIQTKWMQGALLVADGGSDDYWIEGNGKFEGLTGFVSFYPAIWPTSDIEVPSRQIKRTIGCARPFYVTIWGSNANVALRAAKLLNCIDQKSEESTVVYSASKNISVRTSRGHSPIRISVTVDKVVASMYLLPDGDYRAQRRFDSAKRIDDSYTGFLHKDTAALVVADHLLIGKGQCAIGLVKLLSGEKDLYRQWVKSFYKSKAEKEINGLSAGERNITDADSCVTENDPVLGSSGP